MMGEFGGDKHYVQEMDWHGQPTAVVCNPYWETANEIYADSRVLTDP